MKVNLKCTFCTDKVGPQSAGSNVSRLKSHLKSVHKKSAVADDDDAFYKLLDYDDQMRHISGNYNTETHMPKRRRRPTNQ